MLRMMDPDSGMISLDGIPYGQIRLHSLRQQFAVMLQRTHLFSGTLREHFKLPDSGPLETRIWQVLKQVDLHHFVASLPKGLDTALGEDAINLSGGQRARLALARTLLMQRPVLLLDEPLANVDPHSRSIILKTIHTARQTCSCLIITHQMDLLEHADAVYILQQGELKPYHHDQDTPPLLHNIHSMRTV